MKTVTINNLSAVSEQELFGFVSYHLLTQNQKAEDKESCLYRTEEGLKCAAGCLIPDDWYSSEFEGNTWQALIDDGKMPPHHSIIIRKLQRIHDDYEPEKWKSELGQLKTWIDSNSTQVG